MKTLLVARWEFLQRIKTKWFLISTIFLPLIFIGGGAIPLLLMDGGGAQPKNFALIDQTEWAGDELRKIMQDNYTINDGEPRYQWIPITNKSLEESRAIADSLLNNDVIAGYIVIPENLTAEYSVNYYAESIGNFQDQERIENSIDQVIMQRVFEENEIPPALQEKLSNEVNLEAYEVRQGEEKQAEISTFLAPVFYLIILFFSIFVSSQLLMRSVLEERQNRVVEILVSSVTPKSFMAGKILGIAGVSLAQIMIYLIAALVASAYYDLTIVTPGRLALFFAYFIPGFLMFAGFYAAVGSLFTSEQEAQQAMAFMSLIIVIPMFLIQPVIMNPEATYVDVLTYIPPLTPFLMMLKMNSTAVPIWQYALTIGELVIFSGLVIYLAGKVFSTSILLYGKRPTVPEILRWIRA